PDRADRLRDREPQGAPVHERDGLGPDLTHRTPSLGSVGPGIPTQREGAVTPARSLRSLTPQLWHDTAGSGGVGGLPCRGMAPIRPDLESLPANVPGRP